MNTLTITRCYEDRIICGHASQPEGDEGWDCQITEGDTVLAVWTGYDDPYTALVWSIKDALAADEVPVKG